MEDQLWEPDFARALDDYLSQCTPLLLESDREDEMYVTASRDVLLFSAFS